MSLLSVIKDGVISGVKATPGFVKKNTKKAVTTVARHPVDTLKVGGVAGTFYYGNELASSAVENAKDFMSFAKDGAKDVFQKPKTLVGGIAGVLTGFGTVALMQKYMVKPEEKGAWAWTKKWIIAPVAGTVAGVCTFGGINSVLEKKEEEQTSGEKTTTSSKTPTTAPSNTPNSSPPQNSGDASSALKVVSSKATTVSTSSQQNTND